LTGSHLLRELLASSLFAKIKVLSRRPLELSDPRLEVIQFNELKELRAEDPRLKADVYFSCLGTTIKKAGSQQKFREVDFEAVRTLGAVAKTQGARGFILVSAMGANPQSPLFYNRVKGEAEKAILQMKIPGTVIFRPSLLIGDRQESRFVEHMAIQLVRTLSPFMSPHCQKQMGTRVDVLARRMVEEVHLLTLSEKIIGVEQI
jgi:uncharacterized protein YbjT (DUF2867 family)